jgi:hypothetical protein
MRRYVYWSRRANHPAKARATTPTPLRDGKWPGPYFLLVSLTVVLGCVFAYFSVTNLPVFAERLSVVGLLLEPLDELPLDGVTPILLM